MRDKTILRGAFVTILIAIFMIDIIPFHNSSVAVTFDTTNAKKYEFKDLKGICLYSLEERFFFITENSNKKKVACYWSCATEKESEPVAIIKENNYLLLEDNSGEEVAIPLEKSEMGKAVTYAEATKMISVDEVSANSLFELEAVVE